MDSGYSWVILAGAYLNYFIIVGIFKTAGIFYAELIEKYHLASGSTTFYLSILRLFNATFGPLAGFISMTYSFRAVAFTGGCLICLGFTLSAFVSKPEILFFTYSMVVGIGIGLSFSPSIAIVNYNFKKRRALANGIVSSASGLCMVVLSPLFRFSFDTYGLHGGMLLLGGIFFNMCVGSATYRQPSILRKQEMDTENTSGIRVVLQLVRKLFRTFKAILKCPGFILYAVAIALALLGHAGNLIIMPSHLRSRRVPKDVIILILMTIGGVEIFSRIFFGRIIDMRWIKADVLFAINLGIGGVIGLVYPFFDSIPMYFLYSVLLGVFPGSMFAYIPEIIIPVCGLKLFPPAVSLYTLFMNVFLLTGAPITGVLEDITGNWNASFYALGCVQLVSSLIVCLWRICYIQRRTKTTQAIDANGIANEIENVPMIQKVCGFEDKL